MAKLLLQLRRGAAAPSLLRLLGHHCFCTTSSTCDLEGEEPHPLREQKERWWLKLPPFAASIDPSTLGKQLTKERPNPDEIDTKTTILKWVRRCCPGVPANLVQKLFRLRQVSPNENIGHGDVILLPSSVQEFLSESGDYSLNEDEIKYVRSLELYKDPAIIVLNKPHGLPVQGGNGIKISMDILAAASLRYDHKEPPRLVHRLDKDTSGILLLGRTATSTSILHSLFREKTFGASSVIVDNGKSERLTISKSISVSSQIAITEYQVIRSSAHGFTWLELCPLTGRKHQIRVHCTKVLGTPIVGDLKYGWLVQRKWEPLSSTTQEDQELLEHDIPFGLRRYSGSICDKKPKLHLHCREMILPNVAMASKISQSPDSVSDLSRIGSLDLVAPLPYHMQRSWDILYH